MDDKKNGNGNGHAQEQAVPTEPASEKSILTFEFASVGSVLFELKTSGVTPGQMLAVAGWLDWFARKQFDAASAPKEKVALPIMRFPQRTN